MELQRKHLSLAPNRVKLARSGKTHQPFSQIIEFVTQDYQDLLVIRSSVSIASQRKSWRTLWLNVLDLRGHGLIEKVFSHTNN